MKEIHGYQCEKCQQLYKKPEDAEECEQNHEAYLPVIYHCGNYQKPDFNNLRPVYVPNTINVRFSQKPGDIAVYRLEHYGFKGM
jgi:hypothetical protein